MIISNKKPKGRFFIVGKQGGQPVAEWTVTVTAGANGSVSVDDTPGDFAEMVVDGTVLVLEATASEHYAFTQWSDGNTDNPRTITVTSDIALSSENVPMSYSVRVFSNGNGDVSVDGTVGDYDDYCSFDTSLALEALPAPDYSFDSWSDGNTSATRTVTVTGDIVLAASFQEETQYYSVNIYSSGPFTVVVDGVEGDYYESVAEGTELSVEAIIEEGSIFDNWSDGNTDNPRTLTVDGQIELTAYCHEDEYVEPTYLTVNGVQGEGTVSINGGEPDYSVTEEVIPEDCRLIEAFPEEGYEFVEWTTQGQVSVNDSTENPTYACAGNEEAATNIVNAVFQQVEQDFNVDIHAGANGSVSVDGVQGDYLETVPGGTVLEIEAVADEHYAFVQWSDGNTDNPRTLTVDSDIYLGSENDPMSYNVRVYSNGNGDVSVDGMTGDYDDYCSYGSQLELEAVPGTGYEFDSWSDGDTSNPRTLTVDDEIVLAASFKEAQPQPDYFYVEDISGSNNTLSIKKSNTSAPTIEVFKSEDGQNWSSMGSTSTTPITVTIPSNGKVYLKCTTNSWTANRFNTSNVITASGSHRIGGKIMSLLKGDNYEGATFDSSNAYAFCRSFSDDTYLTDASNLILPTNVADYCYAYMFLNCTSLVTGPVLPATTLSQWCYCYMFNTCSSLTSVTTYAQDISATNCVGTWLGNVAATGTFHNLGTATYPSGASGVPSGWTEVHS